MAAIKSMPAGREGTLIIGTDHGMMDIGPVINIGRLMNKYDIHAKQASMGPRRSSISTGAKAPIAW
ncbi:MAG: hypothetical protein WDM89_17845 [Rhizomicrobium sp.]